MHALILIKLQTKWTTFPSNSGFFVGIFSCGQNGIHPYEGCRKCGDREDLAKSGYKPKVKYKSLTIILLFLATRWKPNIGI
jgi:hypothetical protein